MNSFETIFYGILKAMSDPIVWAMKFTNRNLFQVFHGEKTVSFKNVSYITFDHLYGPWWSVCRNFDDTNIVFIFSVLHIDVHSGPQKEGYGHLII